MSRRSQIVADEISARVLLDPNGQHQLEICMPSEVMEYRFTQNQVVQLEAACARYRAITVRADGGPDFHNRKSVPIEVRPWVK
jgi:hypothetical protein